MIHNRYRQEPDDTAVLCFSFSCRNTTKEEKQMSKQRTRKNYEELTFSDDFMFGKVMEDKELCREVLECLLQRPVGELKELQTQRELHYAIDGKPIRLDLYNEDSDGTIYDAEMEKLNHKSVETHQLPKRSRYYQSAIDIDYLDRGRSYRELPDSNVMFICTFDPFGKGSFRYTFSERCREDPELALEDGTEKIFFNCSYSGEEIPESLRSLYDYVENGHVCNELTERIERAVDRGRKNAIWRTQYMKEWVIIQDAREEGREEGRELGIEKERAERIESMLRRGKSAEEITEFCGYPEELVREIEKSLMSGIR